MAEHLEVGSVGEELACRAYERKGFRVIERNFRKKWGEIDLIAVRDQRIHFVEVKTVSHEICDIDVDVIHETENGYRPEDAVHPLKQERLKRAIQSYLIERASADDEWQFDIAAVYLDVARKKASLRCMQDIIL